MPMFANACTRRLSWTLTHAHYAKDPIDGKEGMMNMAYMQVYYHKHKDKLNPPFCFLSSLFVSQIEVSGRMNLHHFLDTDKNSICRRYWCFKGVMYHTNNFFMIWRVQSSLIYFYVKYEMKSEKLENENLSREEKMEKKYKEKKTRAYLYFFFFKGNFNWVSLW